MRAAATSRGATVLPYEGGEAWRFNQKAVESGTRGVLGVLQRRGMTGDGEPFDDDDDVPKPKHADVPKPPHKSAPPPPRGGYKDDSKSEVRRRGGGAARPKCPSSQQPTRPPTAP